MSNYFIQAVLFAFICIQSWAGAAEPAVTGSSFALNASESLVIRLPEVTANLLAPSAGAVASEGISFKQAACFVKIKNPPGGFVVKTPLAAITGTDCSFFLQSNENALKLTATRNGSKILTRKGQKLSVSNGETLVLVKDRSEIRKSTLKDLVFWQRNPSDAFDHLKPAEQAPKKFGELYIYSLAILEKGAGTVLLPDPGKQPQKAVKGEILAPAGSRIITSADETARLRLGEKTLIRISPNSEVLLKPAHIEIVRGDCLIRHGSALLPLKLVGPSPVLVLRDSSVEMARSGDSLLVTIHKGSLKLPESDRLITAGNSFSLSEKGFETLVFGKSSRIDLPGNESYLNFDIFDTVSDDDPLAATDAEGPDTTGASQNTAPANLLQQYELQPQNGGK